MHDMNENTLLQEIEDDLARQRYEKLWNKYGPYVLGGAFVVVAATAALNVYKTYALHASQKTTVAYMDVFQQDAGKDNKPEEMVSSLQGFADKNKGTTQAAFARLKAASYAAKSGKAAEAAKIYDELAKDQGVDTVFRQLADLLSVQTQLDTGDVAALEARLQPLMQGENVWRFTAKEFSGYLALRQGDKEKAKSIFTELKDMPNVPSSIAARSGDVAAWLNGGA